MNACVGVNSYFGGSRSKWIFLVLGQMPTLEYAINHNELAIEYEVHLEANAGVSIVAEPNMLLGYTLQKEEALKDPKLHVKVVIYLGANCSYFVLFPGIITIYCSQVRQCKTRG